ncbi:MAG: collagen binding domain-containing protein [Pyrinomonadaceae bacterium]
MPQGRSILFLLAACALIHFGAREASACSCAAKPTVLEAFEQAGVVVVARAISVEKTENAAPKGRMSDGMNYVHGVKSTKMVVEKVYKGALKPGEEMTFAQGGGADCIWTFDEESVGREFLFYLSAREQGQKIWVAFGCGRSSGLQWATDDLLYLNNLDKVRGKTRLSGTVRFGWGEEGTPSPAGMTLRLTGAKKTYELKTDEHGVYEIYDLPAGKYIIEPEAPHGWKLLDYGARQKGATNQVEVALEDKKHAAADIRFEIDNAISGKVYDTSGKPMDGVCLHLMPAEGKVPEYFYEADCTENGGQFRIDSIPPGSYVLVVNKDGKLSSSEPFGTFYYPNVSEREKAMVITVGPGDILEDFNISVPKVEETITVEGVFLYSDGKPVADESVEFKAEKPPKGVDGDARVSTDAAGHFSIKILKGLSGELFGEMYAYVGKFENCPKLEKAIRQTGRDNAELTTPSVKFRADEDFRGVELKYPFPGCKKAK